MICKGKSDWSLEKWKSELQFFSFSMVQNANPDYPRYVWNITEEPYDFTTFDVLKFSEMLLTRKNISFISDNPKPM